MPPVVGLEGHGHPGVSPWLQGRTHRAVPWCCPSGGEQQQQQQACAQLRSNIQICLLSAAVIEGVSVIMY